MLRPFSKTILAAIGSSRILGIRAGTEHRFIGVWVVTVKNRVFVRSWNDKAGGWYRAFLKEPRGTIQVGDREIAVKAKRIHGERLLDDIDQAYAAKYNTPSSLQYVRGLRLKRRRMTTLEFVPT